MNTYLTMMLECGILHCDPHPGNLKRTPDGRLCILDWGLVTVLQPDLQLAYIEHIAHLTSKDYAKLPADLVKLGFVPAGILFFFLFFSLFFSLFLFFLLFFYPSLFSLPLSLFIFTFSLSLFRYLSLI
jgi:hypothetical protein